MAYRNNNSKRCRNCNQAGIIDFQNHNSECIYKRCFCCSFIGNEANYKETHPNNSVKICPYCGKCFCRSGEGTQKYASHFAECKKKENECPLCLIQGYNEMISLHLRDECVPKNLSSSAKIRQRFKQNKQFLNTIQNAKIPTIERMNESIIFNSFLKELKMKKDDFCLEEKYDSVVACMFERLAVVEQELGNLRKQLLVENS